MDNTLFELVPVSVKPEKEGWYWVQHDSVPGFPSSALFRDNKWLDIGEEDPDYYETDPSHYLRPAPPANEEHGKSLFYVADMKGKVLEALSKSGLYDLIKQGRYGTKASYMARFESILEDIFKATP